MGMVGYERTDLRNQVTKNQKNELRISKFNEHEYDGTLFYHTVLRTSKGLKP
jgi:hypothetical protein